MNYLLPPTFEDNGQGTRTVLNVLGETIVNIQEKVAVYEGNNSNPVFKNGKLYITTHKMYFIPESLESSSFHLPLERVKTITSLAGSFTNSAKIKIEFSKRTADPIISSWVCSICSHNNWDVLQAHCAACGMKNKTSNIKKSWRKDEQPATISCPACTFENHYLLISCEVCETALFKSLEDSRRLEINLTEPATSDNLDSPVYIRLSFRGGGQSQSFAALENAISKGSWKAVGKPVVDNNFSKNSSRSGIQGLVEKAEKTASLTNQQLGEAFQDIQALMDRAAPMVQLASSIASKVQKMSLASSTASLDDSENSLIRNYLVQLGIDSPVTKDVAGSLFHQELAKELGKTIIPILSQPPYMGAIDLVDVYCIFNRARGVGNLVSPADVLKSCNCFSELSVPLMLKRFPSGVNVLQSKNFAEDKILARITSELELESTGLDVTQLSSRLGRGISLEMLNYYLQSAEEKGLVCRDSAPPLGILFYFPASLFYS